MRAVSVGDVMTREVITALPDATRKGLATLMAERGVSGIPIVEDGGALIGIVTKRDVLKETDGSRAASIMTRHPVTVTPEASVRSALDILAGAGVRRLPVVDLQGRLVGIVSESDLMTPLMRDDEEIREEICREVLTPMPWLDCADVAATVNDGEVTLAGTLERRSDRLLLLQIVERIPGVLRVIDRMEHTVDDVAPEEAPVTAPRTWDEGWGE